MTYTQTTTQSYFSRIGNAFKGIVIGLILVIGAAALLFWNEGRTVKRYKALGEGRSVVVCVSSDAVDGANEGKLVHLTGTATTTDVLTDKEFHVSANAIRLSRRVEMYQWREDTSSETKKKVGGGTETVTTYRYNKEWSDCSINSSSFKESGHDNPPMMYESQEFFAANVALGGFDLSASLICSIGPQEDMSVETGAHSVPNVPEAESGPSAPAPEENRPIQPVVYETDAEQTLSVAAPAVPESLSLSTASDEVEREKPAAEPVAEPVAEPAAEPIAFKTLNGGFYIGVNPASPAVGDMRISYQVVRSGNEISVISQQSRKSFVPYRAKTGTVELLSDGIHSADEMFDTAESANNYLAWLLRILGTILMFAGLRCVLAPLAVLADVLPFLGTLVGAGASAVCFLLAMAISLAVIAFAWLFYRPFLGGMILAAAILLLLAVFRRKKVPTQSQAVAAE